MKETDFINQNKDKWSEFEKLSKETAKDPDKLSELYIEMTEDLSFARTFYPKRSVRIYLNFLSQRINNSFSKQKSKFLFSFLDFWRKGLPIEMYRSRRQLTIAFVIFALSLFIGAVSSHIDPEFSRVILGDSYVNMTEEYINEGDPMAVYKKQDETSMFLQITVNNIRVAFYAFILGVFFSIGTSFLLIYNGIMVGAFQYFFYTKNLLLTSFLTIWIHGALEISAIVIAGCAGIVLGNGLLFPKTLTRLQSLQINAKRGIKILIGTTPIFIVAGFLEGFVTRHTEMPNALKWLLILTSFAFIIIYFVVYPRRVAKNTGFDENKVDKPVFVENKPLSKYKLRSVGEIFYDTFQFYRQYFKYFGKVIFVIILPLIIGYVLLLFSQSEYANYMLSEGQNVSHALSSPSFFWLPGAVINVLLFSLNIATVYHSLSKIGNKTKGNYLKTWVKEIPLLFLKTMPIVTIIYCLVFFTSYWMFLLLLLFPFIVLTIYPMTVEKKMFGKSISQGFSFGSKSWGTTFVILLMMIMLTWVFTWAYHNPLPFMKGADMKTFVFDKLVEWHTITVFDNFLTIKNVISSVLGLLVIHLILPLIFLAFGFQYFHMKERTEAITLKKKIKEFGKTNRIFESQK